MRSFEVLREFLLDEAVDTGGTTRAMFLRLRAAPSLAQLLQEMAEGDLSRVLALTAYPRDPRVRSSLVCLFNVVPVQDIPDIARALGALGGTDVKRLLRRRLAEYCEKSTELGSGVWCELRQDLERACVAISAALIRLDPDDSTASEVLAAAIAECDGKRKLYAMRHAVGVYRRDVSTQAMLGLRDALARELVSPDFAVFAQAALALYLDDGPAIFLRIRTTLTREPEPPLLAIVGLLAQMECSDSKVILLGLLESEVGIVATIRIIEALGALAPSEDVVRVLATALSSDSPAIRLRACSAIRTIGTREAVGVAERALSNEVDEVVRDAISALLSDLR